MDKTDAKRITNEEIFEELHRRLQAMTADEFYRLLVDAGIKTWPLKSEYETEE